jgi:hypothetical protein
MTEENEGLEDAVYGLGVAVDVRNGIRQVLNSLMHD